jgi:hypothetical protein
MQSVIYVGIDTHCFSGQNNVQWNGRSENILLQEKEHSTTTGKKVMELK